MFRLKKNFPLLILILSFSQQAFSESPLEKKVKQYTAHTQASIKNAESGVSKLTQKILLIQGMSSSKVRHFLNNLCSQPKTNYLEIGCWQGSTWVSALYGNGDTISDAVAIDDWSQFGGPEQAFKNNCNNFLKGICYRTYSTNAFKIKKDVFTKPINTYFFDGEHSARSHELALTYYDEVLDDAFILVVDDWNWPAVKAGTYAAIKKLNYKIEWSTELPARFNCDLDLWWNGLFVAVITKPSK